MAVSEIEIVLIPRDETVDSLVRACAEGRIPFSGSPDSLWAEFNRRGWSTSSLYEIVKAYESAMAASQ